MINFKKWARKTAAESIGMQPILFIEGFCISEYIDKTADLTSKLFVQ